MNKRKLLAENFIVYGIGTVLCNLIPFIMIPILVRIMPNSSYYMGINDLINSLISLVSVFGLMGMYDALFRLFFDYKEDDFEHQKQVCSTTLTITLFFSSICMVGLFLFREWISEFFFESNKLTYLVVICAISVVLNNVKNIVMTPTRMLNQRKVYVIGSTILPLISYLVALGMVLEGGYLIALPMGALISMIMGIIYFGIINRHYFSYQFLNLSMIKPLLAIGVPLFPTFVIFWVYSSCDKIMIVRMLGVNANGTYAVANKLATISQLLTSAFAGGWSYYNFATIEDERRVLDFSKIIEYFFALGVLAFCICRLSGDFVMELLFTSQYKDTGSAFSYLFVAPIIYMIYQLMGSQFLLIKKTIYNSFIAASGVIFNIILNYVWIKQIGVLGASVATVTSYLIIMLIAAVALKKREMIVLRIRECLLVILLSLHQSLDLFMINESIVKVVSVISIIIILAFYAKEFKLEINNFMKMRKKKNE